MESLENNVTDDRSKEVLADLRVIRQQFHSSITRINTFYQRIIAKLLLMK